MIQLMASAPLPRPPAAAIQWQLYFSACDGCFEIKFAKVQTIHAMINDCSGREQQHLASEQRKTLRSGTQNVFIIHLPAETTAGRVFATVLNIHNKYGGRKGGGLGHSIAHYVATQSAPGTRSPGGGEGNAAKCAILIMQMWNFVTQSPFSSQ